MGTRAVGLPDFGGSATRERRRISLTPLIDVVFILLVFFMLASSYTEWGAINLMSGGDTASHQGTRPTLTLALSADGTLRDPAGAIIRRDDLLDAVTARLDGERGPVVVAPDGAVSLQAVVSVLDALTVAGVAPLSMAREDDVKADTSAAQP